jgi:hypothetical protein
MLRRITLCLALCLGGTARAGDVDPDTERAQALYREGAAAYEAHDYVHALERMEAARALHPAPQLDYNIARCHDRLGHDAPALSEYERYVAQAPAGQEAEEVRQRISVLRARLHPVAAPRDRRWIAPGVLGGVALGLLAAGTGLTASVTVDYRSLDGDYNNLGHTTPALADRAHSLEHRNDAGIALLVVGGVAAAIDVALIAVAARKRSSAVRALVPRWTF